MRHGFRLMMQKGLSSRERKVALKTFHWFIKESFNPEQWDEKQKRYVPIKGMELPSWKHLTRGGHLNGAPLQRGKWGQRLDHVDKKVGKDLLFRRHGRSERLFVVQRTDTVDVMNPVSGPKPDTSGKGCVCNRCLGGRYARSKLTEADLEHYATIGYTRG